MNNAVYSVLTSPLITEKATLANEIGNQVVFRVRTDANKHAIRHAVETLFKVKVEKVRTVQYLGKEKRVGKSLGRKSDWKKAYVTLAEGNRIEFFEGA
ncbi:MAG: 50S ribosomal protein L23 [Deltaproteobacteria bacterium]|nr:50S ribosomal protein L23 [Deltaproteobacteria bacterium]